MSESRRLAAVMAVDVAGYSRLMGENEAGTARSVREHREAARPLVQGHGGRIVKTMGDGVLLEFPSVVAADECAIAVQRLMLERNAEIPADKRIVYRIGVHLGDVLIEGEDIVGDGVNIAARLETICEPGNICLSEDAYRQVRGKVEAAFTDLGELSLRNIARPVRAYSVIMGGAGEKTRRASVTDRSAPPRLSIVVLPFANIGGDPEQEYFVDGVTESLTTDLSRMAGSFVIGRNTAFTYKGKAVDLKQIGRELNVRYVLEGSVQRGGNRLRVNVQLIETELGAHIWAERFGKPVADLFDMQDEIVARLANTLNVELTAAEARRAERNPHPDSTDLTFRGWAAIHRGGAERRREALQCFREALDADEKNMEAWVGMAFAAAGLAAIRPDDLSDLLVTAEDAAKKALLLTPNNAAAHAALSFAYAVTRFDDAVAEAERALALNPSQVSALSSMATAKIFAGRADEAEAHILRAIQLSPRDYFLAGWCNAASIANLWLGKDAEAVAWARRSIETDRTVGMTYLLLAAALANLGQIDEAERAAREALTIMPNFSARVFRERTLSNHPVYLAQRERFYGGMRRAGVPKG